MVIAHLMASPFLGGPERQVLGLAKNLPAGCRSVFLSFAEGGKARPFLEQAEADGWKAIELRANWPHVRRSAQEIARHLQAERADVLCTSGYKPDVIGLLAARQAGVPSVSIAHGWTAANWKVRANELLDRWVMRWFDCVVSVSGAQALKVARAGVSQKRMATIPNAVDVREVGMRDVRLRREIEAFFPKPPQLVVAAAGRLSPEKGFEVFIDMASRVASVASNVGFLLFGEGPLRESLDRAIDAKGLRDRLVMAGFRSDLSRLLPQVDIQVLSSYTEGLPVIVLEAMASGVPVVSTSVGGVPEVIQDGVNGRIVAPGDARALALAVESLVVDAEMRRRLGEAGKRRVVDEFSCALQGERYMALFLRLVGQEGAPGTSAQAS